MSSAKSRHRFAIICLAVLYLSVFLLHDLVFGSSPGDDTSWQLRYGAESADQTPGVGTLTPENHHVCPFCDGFIDNHAELQVPWLQPSENSTDVIASCVLFGGFGWKKRGRAPPSQS